MQGCAGEQQQERHAAGGCDWAGGSGDATNPGKARGEAARLQLPRCSLL